MVVSDLSSGSSGNRGHHDSENEHENSHGNLDGPGNCDSIVFEPISSSIDINRMFFIFYICEDGNAADGKHSSKNDEDSEAAEVRGRC